MNEDRSSESCRRVSTALAAEDDLLVGDQPGQADRGFDLVDLAAPGTGHRLGAARQPGTALASPGPPGSRQSPWRRSAVPEGASALPWRWS